MQIPTGLRQWHSNDKRSFFHPPLGPSRQGEGKMSGMNCSRFTPAPQHKNRPIRFRIPLHSVANKPNVTATIPPTQSWSVTGRVP